MERPVDDVMHDKRKIRTTICDNNITIEAITFYWVIFAEVICFHSRRIKPINIRVALEISRGSISNWDQSKIN